MAQNHTMKDILEYNWTARIFICQFIS